MNENELQLSKELHKNEIDRVVAEIELENAKRHCAENILKVGDLTPYLVQKPIKIKKPLSMRIRQRFMKIKEKFAITFGLR